MPKKVLRLIFSLCFALSSISCASVMSGRTQKLPVATHPSGAIVTVGSQKQTTPATFILDRTESVYLVKIEKPGFEPIEVILKKGVNGWVFGNAIAGGLIGLAIDISSGSASKFVPTEVDVDLIKEDLTEEESAEDDMSQGMKNRDILIVKLTGGEQ